jgi:AcrR family transcriptional regulator
MADEPARGAEARGVVLDAARNVFASRGYARTTMKGIAAAAGVAPEVVRRYYRNKGDLFSAAMRLPTDPRAAVPALLAPGLEGLGDRMVRFMLLTLDDPEVRADLLGLLRAGGSAYSGSRSLQEFIEATVIDRVVSAIGVPDARMRASLISSTLIGVAVTRYLVRLEPLASASDDQVVRMVGPMIQRLVDPRVPLPGATQSSAQSS